MFTIKYALYSLALGVIAIGLASNQQAFARHHHKDGPPPPPHPVTVTKDQHLNPLQSPDDISSFANNSAANTKQQDASSKNGPALLLPDHYTKRPRKTNGKQGWVNSKHSTGKYDVGINMPVSQTADPTQNKTKSVFRRAMPTYEPNY